MPDLKTGPVVTSTSAAQQPMTGQGTTKPQVPTLSRNWMVQIRCKFAAGEIKQHPKPLINGVMVPCEAIEILRDASGVRDALFGLDVSLPVTIEFVDSATTTVGTG